MRIYSLVALLLLSGCSMFQVSFWDDNESYSVAKIRYSVDLLDCSGDYIPQANSIVNDIRFLELYSSSKGSDDLLEMVKPMKLTAEGLADSSANPVFCSLKKKQLEKQSALIADAAMERF